MLLPTDDDTIRKRKEWLKSCGLRNDEIARHRLDQRMTDDAFQMVVAEVFRAKVRKQQTLVMRKVNNGNTSSRSA